MANYTDDYYTEVDAIFGRIRSNPFEDGMLLPDPSPQDSPLPMGPIGWVENADGTDGEAKVIINSDGITILDGKIFLSDLGGDSVLGAAGFAGSWIDFLAHGTYNGSFGSGTTTAITASTLVNTASTDDDYADSISADIPYWVVDTVDVSGGGTMGRFADSDASRGFCLRFTGDVSGRVFQDIPVVPGAAYTLEAALKHSDSTGAWEYQFNAYYQWRDADHAAIGVEHSDGLVMDSADTTIGYRRALQTYTLAGLDPAPANARYLRVKWEIIRNAGDIDVRLGDLIARQTASYSLHIGLGTSAGLAMRPDPDQNFNSFTINSSGVMGWGDGSASEDVVLSRTTANRLRLADGDTFDAAAIALRGIHTTASISSNQNNYDPGSGWNSDFIINLRPTAAVTLTGLLAGSDGEMHFLRNDQGTGGNTVSLSHASASSSAANRFHCSPSPVVIPARGGVLIVYDASNSAWVVANV